MKGETSSLDLVESTPEQDEPTPSLKQGWLVMKKIKVKDESIIQKRLRLRNSSLEGQTIKKNEVKSLEPTHPKIEPTQARNALDTLVWHATEPAQNRSKPTLLG